MRILAVIEVAGDNWSAYAPDVPGCVASGVSKEARANMHAALRMHLDGLHEDGVPLPETHTNAEVVEVATRP